MKIGSLASPLTWCILRARIELCAFPEAASLVAPELCPISSHTIQLRVVAFIQAGANCFGQVNVHGIQVIVGYVISIMKVTIRVFRIPTSHRKNRRQSIVPRKMTNFGGMQGPVSGFYREMKLASLFAAMRAGTSANGHSGH